MTQDRPIYLDFNATTPLLPEVVDAMLPYLREHFGNPSSGHGLGHAARRGVEAARAQVSELLDCDVDEIVFTSGGTEANNLAIRGSVEASPRREVVTSCIEHPAVAEPCAWLEDAGYRVTRLPVDETGITSVAAAARSINSGTALVTVMHSNNETGVLQPVEQLAELAHASGAVMHTDAAQSIGKVRVNVRELGVDLLTVAGHKLYAPKGVGALYVKRGTHLFPFLRGASHEGGLRPGTENVASIVGLGVACAMARVELERRERHCKVLRDLLWDLLSNAIPGVAINGHAPQRLPNTLNVRFPSVLGSMILNGAPRVLASTGSACHAGHATASTVLLAMGIDPIQALGSVRISVGRSTTLDDVEGAADALIASWRRAAARS
jgi:cysteine desulfurase